MHPRDRKGSEVASTFVNTPMDKGLLTLKEEVCTDGLGGNLLPSQEGAKMVSTSTLKSGDSFLTGMQARPSFPNLTLTYM